MTVWCMPILKYLPNFDNVWLRFSINKTDTKCHLATIWYLPQHSPWEKFLGYWSIVCNRCDNYAKLWLQNWRNQSFLMTMNVVTMQSRAAYLLESVINMNQNSTSTHKYYLTCKEIATASSWKNYNSWSSQLSIWGHLKVSVLE